ncbi:S-adenosyl-L-methionine-dependent methyltransferase [Microthyrium microscopicum]|uniref:S-adenosyl-L-methionine-dependent methyltransferase n=1 Tax=Microthyrium microscopicum TaxID=703497 RepID=A0A6A6U5U8_9PEZI|nr:S-adenosyl-L-methionine-dependent methyltransferase [Microthyrium microscopicum]
MSTLADENRQHWDKMASQYDTHDWQKTMLAYVSSQLITHRAIFDIPSEAINTPTPSADAKPYRLLDYACGPGSVTRALHPYLTEARGVDLAANMIKLYNERAAEEGWGDALAVQGNLLSSGEEEAKVVVGDAFDGAIVGFGFHHFEGWVECLRRLGERVKSGGVVGIVDLVLKSDALDHMDEHQKKHMHVSGFTHDQMRMYMAEAGLVDFEMVVLKEPIVMPIRGERTEREVFFARGRKV